MKILRVINSLNIGGAERSVVSNVPIHRKNGFDIDVLLFNGNRTHFYEDLAKKKINIISLGKNNNIYNPLMIFKVAKYINNYDVLHVSLFPALYWVAFAKILTRSKTKLIFTEHNTINRRMGNYFFEIFEQIIYKQYDRIVAISPEANESLSLHLKNKIKVSTIYNGVDVARVYKESKNLSDFEVLKEKNKNHKIILQVASFREQKDQDTIIKSLPLLDENVHVIFVGDGPRMKICTDLAKSMNVDHRISFLGIQNNVHALYGLSDIVVMSSHYEGFGRAAVEGMAAKKPLLASNVAGLAEIVKNHGILFEPGNYVELSQIINKLLANKKLYDDVALKCFNRAKDFDINKMVSAYENIYKTII